MVQRLTFPINIIPLVSPFALDHVHKALGVKLQFLLSFTIKNAFKVANRN